MIDPFDQFTPRDEYTIDLLTGKIIPDMEGDDVERYYEQLSDWFLKVLPKEGISINLINKAILKISPEGKFCIIEAGGRKFTSKHLY
ncbi:MAG: hypothetical protein ACW986_10390 [Promethearchaeota archaeon]